MTTGVRCPHCGITFLPSWTTWDIGSDEDGTWRLYFGSCAACGRLIINAYQIPRSGSDDDEARLPTLVHVWPRSASARPLPPDVPPDYKADFVEAVECLPLSPKASAALSRRCLQHLLREEAGVKKSTLENEINEVVDSGKLPSWLAADLHAIRHVGNFAVHPIKSTNTGEIVEVEPGEAEWLLNVLEGLFDFYFVAPAKAAARRAEFNVKLDDAGKPLI